MRLEHPEGDLIANRCSLTSHGDARLRDLLLQIAESAVRKANPGLAVCQLVGLDGETLHVGERAIDLAGGRRVFVIGAGKATMPIAHALDNLLGARIAAGHVFVKSPPGRMPEYIKTSVASHPIPDSASRAAAEETRRLLRQVRPGDVVLACFTGGSSALFTEPADGIPFEDKVETNRLLLNSGANVVEINAVRKHISKVKGGRLAQLLPPGAILVNLTVSDVIGDRLDCVTDPTVPDASRFADACETLEIHGLWDRVPTSVAAHLRRANPAQESCTEADLGHLERIDHILVHADSACAAAALAAGERGFRPLLLSTSFEGESSQLARAFGAVIRQIALDGNPVPRPCLLIGGGETTVTIDGPHGAGGPNQEFAMRLALELDGLNGVVGLGMDTDGTDGPTPYAGAIVDGSSVQRLRDLGIDPQKALRMHDVMAPLKHSGHIIETGATDTNVNDLKLVLIQ